MAKKTTKRRKGRSSHRRKNKILKKVFSWLGSILLFFVLWSQLSPKTFQEVTSWLGFGRDTISNGKYDGIDVSKHQGKIDWAKVADDKNIKFVYIKATEGASLVDRRYATNLKEAQREGLKVGSYHFFVSRTSADRQFENFRKRVNKSKQDLIPVVDVEKSGCKNATREQLQERLKQFMELVKKEYGTYPIIYSDHHFYNEFLSPEFDKYTLFLARYNNEPPRVKSNAEHIIWQFSERGMVEGIKERVDLDRFANGASMSDISL